VRRLAVRNPEKVLHRGYLAACANCGLVVVHAESTGKPFHMHARSKLCRELGKKRRSA